ncbi:hypothetical protein [Kitasatospora viridis]|uniref:Uncharacterized protein n=1 Tax=Kitasatospora viridis TaxID=281105 RepID=A0A561T6L9_9ACTN|nr:hypothetical protein [Kitasatospora viridis]TWF82763.1 hypothetical protein FHX73_14245 [Kitasatospora viridis]
MELVIVTLTAPTPRGRTGIGAPVLTDLLWVHATAADRVEHITVREAPDGTSYAAGLFLRPADSTAGQESHELTALHLCRTAIDNSPALTGWRADLDPPVHQRRC